MARVKTAGKELAILEAAARVFAGRPFHVVLIDDVATTVSGSLADFYGTSAASASLG